MSNIPTLLISNNKRFVKLSNVRHFHPTKFQFEKINVNPKKKENAAKQSAIFQLYYLHCVSNSCSVCKNDLQKPLKCSYLCYNSVQQRRGHNQKRSVYSAVYTSKYTNIPEGCVCIFVLYAMLIKCVIKQLHDVLHQGSVMEVLVYSYMYNFESKFEMMVLLWHVIRFIHI